MKKQILIYLLLTFLIIPSLLIAQDFANKEKVTLGVDMLVSDHLGLIKGKRIGLITNASGVNGNLIPTIDVLNGIPETKLVALFGPEHGIRGAASGGEKIKDFVDEKTGLTVYSLYGSVRAPTEAMLKNVDVLVFDIQDIGSRTYTYVWTMTESMIAAKKFGKKFIVLDRPNPINGEVVEGNIVEPEWTSFIGKYPVAYCYGLTVGELASLANEEFDIHCDLTVVKMKGWERWMTWKDTGLVWIPTSPHIPEPDSAWYYPTTGIFGELKIINEGVGYTQPFKIVGSPDIKGEALAKELNAKKLPGVYFYPTFYTPFYGPLKDKPCQGCKIIITDFKTYQPVNTGYYIMAAIEKLFPEAYHWGDSSTTRRWGAFDRANGSRQIRWDIMAGNSAEELIASWQDELNKFKEKRKKYLLY